MRIKLLVCHVLLTLILAGCAGVADQAVPQAMSAGQHEQRLEKQVAVKLNYLLFLPEGYGQDGKKWPMILFLHGAGERGNDLKKVKVHGPPELVQERKDFPFIVVSPQCPAGQWWPLKIEVLMVLLEDITYRYEVDPQRIYLTGLSMGGFGTWSLACTYPDRFAAIAPICGGGQPYLARRLKNLPVWAFHGARDKVVPLKRSEEMVNAVNKADGEAKLTIYPHAGHDSWTETYNNQELYTWFLSHLNNKVSK